MVKLIPLVIVLGTIIVPMLLASRPRPKRHVRTLYVAMGLVTIVWVFLCLDVYPRYVLPE